MFAKLSKEQKFILWVLALINFFNYIDRQVIFPLFHNIQVAFHVSDAALGFLGTVFMLVHSLTSVPLGVLADKYSRKAIIAGGVAFWSVATFASGLAGSFRALLGIRSAVGVGEASYAPAATAMISDNFPQGVRAQAQGFFSVGMFAGGTVGAMIGGIIAYQHNWRYAFFIVAIPGIILALLATKIVEKKKDHDQPKIVLIDLLTNRALFWVLVSGVFSSFAVGAYVSWGIEFIRRYKHYNLEQASIILGLTMLAAGLLGVFLGSYIADYMQRRMVSGRAFTIGMALVLAAPLMFLGVSRHAGPLFLFYLFAGTVLLSVYQAPAVAVIHDVVPKHMRATSYAFYLLVVHLLGDTPSPAVVGKLSDMYSLRFGLELMTVFVFLGGLAFFISGYYIETGKSKIYTDAEEIVAP